MGLTKRHSRRFATVAISAALGVATTAGRARGASGDVYNLGTFGGSESYGTAVNDAGQTAGWAYNDGAGGLTDGMRAFLLDASAIVPEPTGAGLLTLLVVPPGLQGWRAHS